MEKKMSDLLKGASSITFRWRAICFGITISFITLNAATYYVSPTGNNSNSGTEQNPWATPGYASRQIQAGDVLIIKGGTYSLSQFDSDIIIPPSGNASAWVTIKGEIGNRPILAGSDNLLVAIDLAGKDYIRIENLDITSNNGANFRDGISAVGNPANHIVLKDLYIHHLDEFGIDFGDTFDFQLLNCQVAYCGFGAVGGPTGQSGGWRDVSIQNCYFAYSGHYYQGSSGPGPYDRPDGFGIEPSSGPIEIVGTTVEHNRGDGIDSKAENTNIHECIVANNFADGVKLWGTGSQVTNCLIYGRGDGDATATPWAAIVIDTQTSYANFEVINVTVDDYVGKNYVMYVQYDHPSLPINLICRNTIFSSRGANASIYLASGVNRTFEYNLYYFPNTSSVLIHGGTSYDSQQVANIGAGNSYSDPLFISPAFGTMGNYHLQQNSPAIDAGTVTGAPAKDLDGRNRPFNSDYDIGCYENEAPVAVELVSFCVNAKNGLTELLWKTASESNNYGFEIQRSEDGKSFTTIGFAAGNGTTMVQQNYIFFDTNVNVGSYYYRLKQIDYDGTFNYSSLVQITFAPPHYFNLGQNYPNPFNSATTIPFEISNRAFVRLTLYDGHGRLVKTLANAFFEAGNHELRVNVVDLASGIYFYELAVEQSQHTKKMVVLF